MTSIIRRFIDRCFPGNGGPTVIILGLDATGKTTLLYLLRLGQVMQTIPTIGFNVEEVKAPTASGSTVKMTAWDVGTGCGIEHLYGVLHHYTEKGDALIWMVDSCDKYRLEESVEAFKKSIDGMTASRSEKASQTLPILILANKTDLPGAVSIDEIRLKYAKALSGRTASVFKVSLTQSLSEGGLLQAFDWLSYALNNAPPAQLDQLAAAQVMPDLRSSNIIHQKLESWLARTETDSSPKEFLSQFEAINLPAWDHYTHIRIAYVILTTHGRQKGKDLIFEGIEKYITQSPQTRGRTFHVTMTYFWIQIVHFGIRSLPPPSSPARYQSTAAIQSNSQTSHWLATPDDFARFLLLNPHVADGNLWADYYSKEVMMTPGAKAEMVLPDKKPLPNLVVRDSITAL